MNRINLRSKVSGLLIAFIVGVAVSASAQQDENEADGKFEFLPEGLHFSPLKANHQEARIGLFKYFGSANLKVDVGNTIDVLALHFSESRLRITAGIDFMAYAFISGSQGMRLQVDALDGFFGGNFSFSRTFESSRLQARLRILHLSAHLVDGHYNPVSRQWLDNREPIPFAKNFGELVVAHELQSSVGIFRYYGGITYAGLVRPGELERYAFSAGFEIASNEMLGNVLEQPAYPFIANHFSLAGNPGYTGSDQAQIGVKFGEWNGKGVVLYLAYYTGNSFFSEYYDERVSVVGAGFTVDFP